VTVRLLAVLLWLMLHGGCASTALWAGMPIDDVQRVAGVWRGWLITPRDYVAATLTITNDGGFELSAPRTWVTGIVARADGGLRFQALSGRAAGGWHGTITLYEHGDTRLLKIARDDRLFPGRFTPDPDG